MDMKHELVLPQRKYRGEDNYRIFSVRISEDTMQELEDLVARSNRSRNELICLLLNYALNHCRVDMDAEHVDEDEEEAS